MLRVKLLTYGDRYVTSVLVFPMNPMPEVIGWGTRLFVRRADGQYVEGLLVVGFTEEEYSRQGRTIYPGARIEEYVSSSVPRKVIINGKQHEVTGVLSFAEIVRLAGLTGNPSVTYAHAIFGREGMLYPGGTIEVVAGTLINCCHTGAA